MRRIFPAIRQRARELRHPQTPTEQILWANLRTIQVNGYKFRRQHPIGRFIVDFYCAQEKLVVEVDGDSHAEQEEYDHERTAWLKSQGYRVIRFTNREVKDNLAGVLGTIEEALAK